MFGLGMGEIVIIAIVALLFLGPDKLPSAAKTIGKTIRSFRSQTRDLTDSLERDTELGDAVRELRSALHDDPRHVGRQPPGRGAGAPPEDGADNLAGEDHSHLAGEGGADHLAGEDHSHLAGGAEPHPPGEHELHSSGHADGDADEDELDESVELAEPIGGEPDVPTVRPARGSVARLYSESDGDAPTEPPRQPKPADEGNV